MNAVLTGLAEAGNGLDLFTGLVDIHSHRSLPTIVILDHFLFVLDQQAPNNVGFVLEAGSFFQ